MIKLTSLILENSQLMQDAINIVKKFCKPAKIENIDSKQQKIINPGYYIVPDYKTNNWIRFFDISQQTFDNICHKLQDAGFEIKMSGMMNQFGLGKSGSIIIYKKKS